MDDVKVCGSVVNMIDKNSFNRIIELSEKTQDDDTKIIYDTALFIPAVKNGMKPGATTSFDLTETTIDEINILLSELGFAYRTKKINEYDTIQVQYANNEEILDKIEFGVEDKNFGTFLGVPEKDNRWYDEQDMPTINEVTPIPEYLELSSYRWDGLKYARIVSWICRPTVEGLKRTIDIGKKWYNLSVKLSEDYGYELGKEYAEMRMSRLGNWYTFR